MEDAHVGIETIGAIANGTSSGAMHAEMHGEMRGAGVYFNPSNGAGGGGYMTGGYAYQDDDTMQDHLQYQLMK